MPYINRLYVKCIAHGLLRTLFVCRVPVSCSRKEVEVTLAEKLEYNHAYGMCNIRLPRMSNVPMANRFGEAK